MKSTDKKIQLGPPGIHYVLREYHGVLVQALKEWDQTYEEAAEKLDISAGTFGKMVRLEWKPVFHTNHGRNLKDRLEKWTGLTILEIYPEAFFSDNYVRSRKIHEKDLPFRLLMKKGGHKPLNLLSAPHPIIDILAIVTKPKRKRCKKPKAQK